MKLRPFFSFFGGKWTLGPHYLPPAHDQVVEAFAGSAGYATRYCDRRVLLIERDPQIAALWRYLIKVSPSEIASLPLVIECVDALLCAEEARTLIGFWIARGSTASRKTPSAWYREGRWPNSFWGASVRARIARQVEAIRHWRIVEGSYVDAPDITATWFVDPPYQIAGRAYRYNDVDYEHLATWARARAGLTIVCEATGASWLPFVPFRSIRTTHRSAENRRVGEVVFVQSRII